MQKDGKKMGVLALVFYSIVTFFYIYQVELSFLGIPAALHSRRIAAVILVVSGILAGQLKGNICYPNLVLKKNVHSYIVFCVILTILSYFLLLTIGKAEGVHLFEAMLNILLFGIPVYWAHTKIYTSLDDFMVFSFMFISAAVIFTAAAFLSVNLFLGIRSCGCSLRDDRPRSEF